MSAKEIELEQCLVDAEKHLKTSFLKRSPNYELAADRYQRAAQLARGQHEKQRDLLLKVSTSFLNPLTEKLFPDVCEVIVAIRIHLASKCPLPCSRPSDFLNSNGMINFQAADCFVKQGSFYSAGKQVEAAALVSRDMKDFAQVSALFERASNLFVQHRFAISHTLSTGSCVI